LGSTMDHKGSIIAGEGSSSNVIGLADEEENSAIRIPYVRGGRNKLKGRNFLTRGHAGLHTGPRDDSSDSDTDDETLSMFSMRSMPEMPTKNGLDSETPRSRQMRSGSIAGIHRFPDTNGNASKLGRGKDKNKYNKRSGTPDKKSKKNDKKHVVLTEPPVEILEDFSTTQVVAAFEHEYLENTPKVMEELEQSELSIEDINKLFARRTLRVTPVRRRKRILWRNPKPSNVASMTLPDPKASVANWDDLDLGKKKRRINSFIIKHPTAINKLSEIITKTIPIPQTIEEYKLSASAAPLIYPSDTSMNVELGDRTTNLKEQMNWLNIEEDDMAEKYYAQHFKDKPHYNIGGVDGPNKVVLISIEKPDEQRVANTRVLVRTGEGELWLFVPTQLKLRDAISCIKRDLGDKYASMKLYKMFDPQLENKLVKFENDMSETNIKIGVLVVKEGQTTENEFYGNNDSRLLDEFLECIGTRIRLLGWNDFKAGLDVKEDRTGTESVFTKFMHYKVMFHVSTMLPFNPKDAQQVGKKRHIGNDIVVVVFMEAGDRFDPTLLTSNFIHVFIIVSVCYTKDGELRYKVAVASKQGVRPFGPKLPKKPIFAKGKDFRRFLLTKILNAERAAMESPVFKIKIKRTRNAVLSSFVQDAKLKKI